MTIEQYRKKPVTIEAVQWTGSNLREVITFTDGPPDTRTQHAGMMWENYEDLVRRDGLKIFTLEGAMLASPGDWIIKGVKGEFYPCKPDIFAATYEPAALRREREPVEPVEPVAWLPTATVKWLSEYDGPACATTTAAHNRPIKSDGGVPVYATQPDALALVAAAYRDAADKALNGNIEEQGHQGLALEIACSTPADATAALAAIERAAYERGVRDALTEAIKEANGSVTIGGQRFLTAKLDDLEPALLALLTQEGR